MSSWFGSSKKKSPKQASSSGIGGLVSSSGNYATSSSRDQQPPPSPRTDMKLEVGGVQGLHNPLSWDNVPSSLKQKFPHWKQSSPLMVPAHPRTSSEGSASCSLFKSSTGGRQQPKHTLPYIVMDSDTLNSIAIKFETTPADLARLNKKPLANFTIFSGDVLYVPDHDEMERAAPKPAPPPEGSSSPAAAVPSPASHQRSAPSSVSQSSPEHHVGSQDTLRSASVSNAPTSSDRIRDNSLPTEEGGVSDDKEGVAEEKAEVFSSPSSRASSPPSVVDHAREFEDEITDSHIMIMSKYMSDDQGCIHGNLVLNQTVMMFSPFRDDPIVKEHGASIFEVVIPLQDVTFAAIAKDVTPPTVRWVAPPPLEKDRESAAAANEQMESVEASGVCGSDGGIVITCSNGDQVEGEVAGGVTNGCGTNTGNQIEERDNGQHTAGQVGGSSGEEGRQEDGMGQQEEREELQGVEQQDDGKELQEAELIEEKERLEKEGLEEEELEGAEPIEEKEGVEEEGGRADGETPTQPSGEVDEVEEVGQGGSSGGEVLQKVVKDASNGRDEVVSEEEEHLLSMSSDGGHENPTVRATSYHKISEGSVDSLLSDHALFLHVRVSPKSLAAYTYEPLNRPVGVDIPSRNPFISRQSSVHQVKTAFCFAVAKKRTGDIVHFLYEHRPCEDMPLPPSLGLASSWQNNCYVILSTEERANSEELLFSDDHFTGGRSCESWEVFSMNDLPKYRTRIERMEVESHLPLPVLHMKSELMQDKHLRALSNHLPSEAIGHDWVLIYSTFVHGISLRTLYRNMSEVSTAVVLLVQDEYKKLFGAVVTCPLKLSEKFRGTGESFLFSFPAVSEGEGGSSNDSAGTTDMAVYQWTGENSYIVKGSPEGLYIGCGDGHTGLWVDEHLRNGSSQSCSTFNNECLSTEEEFECMGLEAWGFLYT